MPGKISAAPANPCAKDKKRTLSFQQRNAFLPVLSGGHTNQATSTACSIDTCCVVFAVLQVYVLRTIPTRTHHVFFAVLRVYFLRTVSTRTHHVFLSAKYLYPVLQVDFLRTIPPTNMHFGQHVIDSLRYGTVRYIHGLVAAVALRQSCDP